MEIFAGLIDEVGKLGELRQIKVNGRYWPLF